MNYIKLLFFIIVLHLNSSAFAQMQGIIVWDLEPKSNISINDIESISGIIASEVQNYSKVKVITGKDIQTILNGEMIKRNCGSEDTFCLSEIGGAMGVSEAISGDLGRVEDIWILNLRWIDVKKVEVKNRISIQVEGRVTNIIKKIPNSIRNLFLKDIQIEGDSKSIDFNNNKTKLLNDSNIFSSIKWYKNPWVYGTASVVFALGGGYYNWLARDINNKMNKTNSTTYYNELEKDRNINAALSYIQFGVSGVLMTTAIVFWLEESNSFSYLDFKNQNNNVNSKYNFLSFSANSDKNSFILNFSITF